MSFDSLGFSDEFFRNFAGRQFSPQDRARVLRSLGMLDENERHPSLRVHQLQGNLEGIWSASVSDVIRIHFIRLPDGRKRCINLTRHYND